MNATEILENLTVPVSELNTLTAKELQAIAKDLGVKGWHSARKAELVESVTEILNEAAAKKVEEKTNRPMTRKECIAELKTLGYTGPTSYLMPKLREIVAEQAAKNGI